MGGVYSVALVGFTQGESATFNTFFATCRPSVYRVQDEVIDAHILIVNADSPQAMHWVRYAELPGKVLLLGLSDHGTGWPVQHKPAKLSAVVAALDALVGTHQTAAPRQPAADPAKLAYERPSHGFHSSLRVGGHRTGVLEPAHRLSRFDMERGFAPTQPLPVGDLNRFFGPVVIQKPSSGLSERAVSALALAKHMAVPLVQAVSLSGAKAESVPTSAPVAPKPWVLQGPRGDMLLVAESLVEGRILYKRFQRYGLSIDWLREAGQALQLLKAHPYRVVAIDRLNGKPDVYQVCRSVKQRKLANGQSPVVIMFAPTAGSMDRMKAGLAGSDAYFSRSVGEADLYKFLSQHRLLNQRAFAKTDIRG